MPLKQSTEYPRPPATAPHVTSYDVPIVHAVSAPALRHNATTPPQARPAVSVVGDTTSASTTTTSTNGVTQVEFDLEANADAGIVFGNNPLRVMRATSRAASASLGGRTIDGYYFHSLKLPGFEIKNVVQEAHLNKIMSANESLPRRLIVSSHPPQAHASTVGCQYIHDVPATSNLGVSFIGFPAKIQSVDHGSPMAGKIHPGQSVYAVLVPGMPALMMQSGGFTGARVSEHLQTYCHVPNKQLVVIDQQYILQDNTSSGACDCIIL
jgi:hypothetical protein